MQDLNFQQLAAFVAVVRSSSFTAAAEALDTDKAQVSRLVSRLEKALGAQLLTRTTRSLTVTEIGRGVFDQAVLVLAAIEETQAAVATAQGSPSGLLRLTCGEEFGRLVVGHWILSYQSRYAQVRVDAVLTDRVVDLVHEGFDVSIRVGKLPDSGLAARKLGEITYALYASPRLVARQGLPQTGHDLLDIDYIAFSGGSSIVRTLVNREARLDLISQPKLTANNYSIVAQAAMEGFGFALLPRFLADPFVSQGRLVEIMPGWTRPNVPVHAVFPSSRYLTPKVRGFVDIAVELFTPP
jgi:LysR family transcriptional regulator, regulator for bpeEF and oprC